MMPEADHLALKHDGGIQAGFYLDELMLLEAAGYTVRFATPDGPIPRLDKGSVNARSVDGDGVALEAAHHRLEELKLLSATDSPVISLACVERIGVTHFDAANLCLVVTHRCWI